MSLKWRHYRVSGVVLLALTSGACLGTTGLDDSNSGFFARIDGTVTQADGTPVSLAQVAATCVGVSDQPFGLTGQANANGRFQLNLNVPTMFQPLEGLVYACRVLSPFQGSPQGEVSVMVPVSTNGRPVTEVTVVIPAPAAAGALSAR